MLEVAKVGLAAQPLLVEKMPPSPEDRKGQPSAPKARAEESGALWIAAMLPS